LFDDRYADTVLRQDFSGHGTGNGSADDGDKVLSVGRHFRTDVAPENQDNAG
jgi:hypothetical protein